VLIAYSKMLWDVVSTTTRQRLVVAAVVLTATTLVEGAGLMLLLNLLDLLTSTDFSAHSFVIDLFGRLLGTSDGGRVAAAIGGATALSYLARAMASVLALRWVATVALREEATVVRRLTACYLHAPLAVHLRRNSAEFARTLNMSTRMVFGPMFPMILGSLADVVSLLVVAGVLVFVDPIMAVFTAVYFALVGFVWDRVIRARLTRAANRIHKEQALVFRHTVQSLAAIREVKVTTSEAYFAEGIHALRQQLMPSYRTVALSNVLPRYVLEVGMLGAAIAVAAYAFATKDTEAATATLGVFLAGGFRIIAPINKVLSALTSARNGMRALEQIREDLVAFERYVVVDDDDTRLPAGPIETRDLRFSYDGDGDVIKGVGLRIEPGSAVALVGSSGAGKSTLADLLLGLLTPSGGQIFVGGRELRDVERQWQRSIGYVPQQISLLDDTVRANVALGHPNLTDVEIWHALRLAQLADMIEALPEGLDTRIGERGVRFSGGQRQRLGIARALARRPHVLILDEATSALDNETEHNFIDVLDSLHGTLTTITIAHRLSTVRHADQVFFLEDGRVQSQGTFDDLVRRVPDFARLAELAGMDAARAR
jgi:ABC-type multidrug transport system fused ATPase/permease subunit